jgi:hypothetical protein
MDSAGRIPNTVSEENCCLQLYLEYSNDNVDCTTQGHPVAGRFVLEMDRGRSGRDGADG